MKQISGLKHRKWEFNLSPETSKGIKWILVLVLMVFNPGLVWLGAQSPCDDGCAVQCEDQINVSLDASCEATITPAMGGIGIDSSCNSYFDIVVYDEFGNEVPDDLVDLSHRNTDMTFRIFEPLCGNSCWGDLLVEYKLPPQIVCPPDMTLSCGALNLLGVPPAVGACAGFEVFLFSETRQNLTCDSMFTNIITRTYKAVDEFGNEDTCSHTIYLERLELTDIVFPEPRSQATGNAISCSDPVIEFDEDGIPLPWPTNPATGSGSGVPILCDDDVVNGLICPTTGSGTGIPLIPGPFTGSGTTIPTQVGCSATVLYTDIELPELGCVRKIMRSWEVREWWCNGESSQGGIQLIEIIDDEAPTFDCPADFTVTTNDDCAGSVILPPVSPVDECGHGSIVAIDYYPLGFLNGNGGTVQLEVGENAVTYIVSDSCYNSSTCQMTVTVRDNTEPVAICDQDVDINLGSTGEALVFVETFDEGSWDECGLDRVEIRRMDGDTLCDPSDTAFDESILFCCTDVGNDDLMIILRAVDEGGNENQCMIRVNVEDKMLPSMTCPPDATIDCRDAFDLDNLGISFGNPVISDNCAETQVVEEIVTDDINQCNIGEITRIMELRDPSGTAYQTCIQHIFINNLTPFVESNIQWPLDYEVEGGCIDELLPQALPDNFNYPVFTAGDDECSLLGYDYQDVVFEGAGGGQECLIVERTWTVINWCSQIDGIFETFTIPDPQIIELVNTQAPVMDDQDDQVYESGNVNCEETDVFIERSATDDCDNALIWTYILRDEDMNIIETGDTNVVEGVYSVGSYNVEWAVSDGCGNFDFDSQNFEVINTKSPSPVCLGGMNLYLQPTDIDHDGMADDETVELTTDIIDGGSFHTCNNSFTLSLGPDVNVQSIIYNCDDLGVQTVRLYATDDESGAQDYCEIFVNVIDTNSVDICTDMMNLVDVEGDIHTEAFERVEGVMVDLGIPDLEDMTDATGNYAFEDMPMGGHYVITPRKDDDHLNGISTLDLIFIQRHVLGIEKLDSPYKILAADVNNSGDVSTIDMIELRKLILGIYDELPENSSWRFVDAEYGFVDPSDPWLNEIPEDYEIHNLNTDMKVDFVGLKVGDVNNSVVSHNIKGGEQDALKTLAGLELRIDRGMIPEGVPHELKIYADNYQQLSGWQAAFGFDSDMVNILDVIPGELDIKLGVNAHIEKGKDSRLKISYSKARAESVSDDRPLFSVIISSNNSLSSDEIFGLAEDLSLSNESYTERGHIRGVNISTVAEAGLEILSASPNPWIESTAIRYSSERNQAGVWQFYDVNGRLLNQMHAELKQGIHTFEIDREMIGSAGVVYVKLIAGSQVSEYKMILID